MMGERIHLYDKHQDFVQPIDNDRQFIWSNSLWTTGFRNQNTTQSGARGVWIVEFHSFTHEQIQSIQDCYFQLCIFSPSSGYLFTKLKTSMK